MLAATALPAAPLNQYNPPNRNQPALPIAQTRPTPSQTTAHPPTQSRTQPGLQSAQTTPTSGVQPQFPVAQRPEYRFVVMGDAGTGDERQAAVAQQLSRWQQAVPFKSMIALGDNVYQEGEPALFQERIAKPYEPLFQRGVKFFPVMGNHDVKKGFGNWQLAFWGVPPYYNFKLGPKGNEVEFFAIDTNLMTPGLEGNGQGSPSEVRQKTVTQMLWLDKALASSTAPMKVVYGHHPMHSLGASHKPVRAGQQKALADQLEPTLVKYGVDFYMAGHEHHYEKPKQFNGIYHVVSGAGGKLDSAKRGGPEGNGLVKQLHFMLFDITPQGLTYRTVAADGQVIDSGLIPRKNAGPAPAPVGQNNWKIQSGHQNVYPNAGMMNSPLRGPVGRQLNVSA
jgi:hypothetical protein